MPIHKAPKKHLRQTVKRTERNRIMKGRLKSARKRADELLLQKKRPDNFDQEVKTILSVIDRSVTKGVIHKNTAARYKSRLLKRIK